MRVDTIEICQNAFDGFGYLIGRGEFQLVKGWDENVRDKWKRNDVAVHRLPQRWPMVAELGRNTYEKHKIPTIIY